MIKAGSILYAILICILVGVFCLSILMISSYSKIHQSILFAHTELINTNKSAEAYYLSHLNTIQQRTEFTDLLDNGMTSKTIVKQWGFYKVLQTASKFKKDTVVKYSLVGQKSNKSALALYLTNNIKPLYMAGKAKIKGNISIPQEGIKKGYIKSNAFSNPDFLEGTKVTSKNKLPQLKDKFETDYEISETYTMEEIKSDSIYYNSFRGLTIVIECYSNNIENKHLKGNIIIRSKDSIFISNTNVLENVIIEAPKVVFESGFVGVVQVSANKKVVLEDKVLLKYPSGIYLESDSDSRSEITIGEDSMLIGGVVLTGSESIGDSKRLVTIEKNAEVVGSVYCKGSTQLKGMVTGSLYTDKFFLKTGAATYDNYILDGQVDGTGLPENFVGLSLFNDTNNLNSYAIIKSL